MVFFAPAFLVFFAPTFSVFFTVGFGVEVFSVEAASLACEADVVIATVELVVWAAATLVGVFVSFLTGFLPCFFLGFLMVVEVEEVWIDETGILVKVVSAVVVVSA